MWLMAFLPAWKKKNNMTLLLFFEVKAVIEEHYERRIEFYRYVNPPLSREAERELGEWKGKVREIMGMVCVNCLLRNFCLLKIKLYICENLLGGKI